MIKIKIKEALVTDYLSSNDLHKIMHNPEFGSFSSYQQIDGMIVRTDKSRGVFDGAPGAIKSRYWKFIKNSDGNWEVYEVDNDGRKIGSPFLAESKVRDFRQVDWDGYAGASNFEDGSSPLIYSTDFLDVVVSYNEDSGNVDVDIYTENHAYRAEADSKNQAIQYFDSIVDDLDSITSDEELRKFIKGSYFNKILY